MTPARLKNGLFALLGWLVALTLFFPVFWMTLTAFKTEQQAYSSSLLFIPTWQSFREVFARSNYAAFAWNSCLLSVGSALLCFLLAVPAAYKMVFYPGARTRSLLVWMLSTKMMPAVGVLLPVYLLFRAAGLLDSVWGLILICALINLPIAVWMSFSYFCEVPAAILEAARVDGATLWREVWHILLPLALPGISSTALLLIILSWNEAFWTLNLTSAKAAPLTVFIASYSSPEGLFWAKLSAASVLAIAPIMAMGWLTQKRLVNGLTLGAIK